MRKHFFALLNVVVRDWLWWGLPCRLDPAEWVTLAYDEVDRLYIDAETGGGG